MITITLRNIVILNVKQIIGINIDLMGIIRKRKLHQNVKLVELKFYQLTLIKKYVVHNVTKDNQNGKQLIDTKNIWKNQDNY